MSVMETYLTPEAVPSNIEATLAVMCKMTSSASSEKPGFTFGAVGNKKDAKRGSAEARNALVPIFTRKLVRGGGAIGNTAIDLQAEFAASASSVLQQLPPRHTRAVSAGVGRARSATSGGSGGVGVFMPKRHARSASVDSSASGGSHVEKHYR